MSAHVLLNLLNKLERAIICEACQAAHACLTIELNFALSLYLGSLLCRGTVEAAHL